MFNGDRLLIGTVIERDSSLIEGELVPDKQNSIDFDQSE
jgi:hypothetical protein